MATTYPDALRSWLLAIEAGKPLAEGARFFDWRTNVSVYVEDLDHEFGEVDAPMLLSIAAHLHQRGE